MSFIGTVGVVAQQANQAAGPTDVSIAENASSGQNNAFSIADTGQDIMTVEYSDWTSATSESFGTQFQKDISSGDLGDFEDDGLIRMDAYAYLRATGATSYSWSGSVYTTVDFGGGGQPTTNVAGAGGGGQDGTSSGVGIRFEIHPGTDKAGRTVWPQNGSRVIYKLTGTATNSDGSTTADLYLRYDFTN